MPTTQAVPDHARQDSLPPSSIASTSLGTGFALFLMSFCLPAVRSGPDTLAPGWMCAWLALAAPVDLSSPMEYRWILFACGLINPLLLSYLLLRMFDIARTLRRLIAVVALAFIPLNWTLMTLVHPPLTPMIGHFAWIGGLLLILVSEAINAGQAPSPARSKAAATSPAPRR